MQSKWVVVLLVVAGVLMSSTRAGATSPKARLLSLTDLPSGWSVTSSANHGKNPLFQDKCFAPLQGFHGHSASASFVDTAATTTFLRETLSTGSKEVAWFRLVTRTLKKCHSATVNTRNRTIHLSIRQMSFPKLTRTSVAFSMRATVTGATVGADLVTFRAGSYVGALLYGTPFEAPNLTTLLSFAKQAVAKAEGK